MLWSEKNMRVRFPTPGASSGLTYIPVCTYSGIRNHSLFSNLKIKLTCFLSFDLTWHLLPFDLSTCSLLQWKALFHAFPTTTKLKVHKLLYLRGTDRGQFFSGWILIVTCIWFKSDSGLLHSWVGIGMMSKALLSNLDGVDILTCEDKILDLGDNYNMLWIWPIKFTDWNNLIVFVIVKKGGAFKKWVSYKGQSLHWWD